MIEDIKEFYNKHTDNWPMAEMLEKGFHIKITVDKKNTYIDDLIRTSEFAHRLINAVNDALYVVERALKEMNDDTYMCLIDGMHGLAMVGERNSNLYKEMTLIAHRAMHRMKYY